MVPGAEGEPPHGLLDGLKTGNTVYGLQLSLRRGALAVYPQSDGLIVSRLPPGLPHGIDNRHVGVERGVEVGDDTHYPVELRRLE